MSKKHNRDGDVRGYCEICDNYAILHFRSLGNICSWFSYDYCYAEYKADSEYEKLLKLEPEEKNSYKRKLNNKK